MKSTYATPNVHWNESEELGCRLKRDTNFHNAQTSHTSKSLNTIWQQEMRAFLQNLFECHTLELMRFTYNTKSHQNSTKFVILLVFQMWRERKVKKTKRANSLGMIGLPEKILNWNFISIFNHRIVNSLNECLLRGIFLYILQNCWHVSHWAGRETWETR